MESEYSDDVDFMEISEQSLQALLPVAKSCSVTEIFKLTNQRLSFLILELLVVRSLRMMERLSEDQGAGVPRSFLAH